MTKTTTDPYRMDEETTTTLINSAQNGATNRDAAAIAGISESTLYNWLSNPELTEFGDAYTRAKSTGRQKLVRAIHEQAAHDWRAAAWLLERMDPTNWGKAELDPAALETKLAAYLKGIEDGRTEQVPTPAGDE